MTPVSANAGEYRSRIGLDSLYIAEVTVDTAAAYTADTPEWLAPAAEAIQEPSVSTETQFADDSAYDVISSQGETVINLTVTGIPGEMMAKITGETFDAASGRVFDTGGAEPPYFALMFRSKKSNGSYRYYSYLKGRFDVPAEETATETDKPAPKTVKLKFHAIKTIHVFDIGSEDQSVKRVYGDEDTTSFSGATWFSQVQTPVAVSPSALSAIYDPLDNAAGVAVTKTITITFNNALPDVEIYHVTVTLADGTLKACTNTLDTTKKIMTIDPNTNLAGGSTYLVTVAVTDVYGQRLNAVVNFGTV